MKRSLVLVAFLIGCGGGSDKSPTTDGGTNGSGATGAVALDDYAAVAAKVFCMKELACCTPTERGSGDEPACEAQILANEQAGVAIYKQLVAANHLSYDPIAAGQRFDFGIAEVCGQYFFDFEHFKSPTGVCQTVFKPLVAKWRQLHDRYRVRNRQLRRLRRRRRYFRRLHPG